MTSPPHSDDISATATWLERLARPVKERLDDWLASRLPPPSAMITQAWRLPQVSSQTSLQAPETKSAQPKRLVLFAHFNPQADRQVSQAVLVYLQALRALPAEVIFISGSPLDSRTVQEQLSFCSQVICTQNKGLDFGSWRVALSLLPPLHQLPYQQLILANDSVYGPFFPLAPIFQAMEARRLDLWGMTRSFELSPHLQSYFLVFEHSVLAQPALQQFWQDFKFYRSKQRIITRYERGLSELAHNQGWKTGAWSDDGEDGQLTPRNPTLFAWEALIARGFPFLKTELVRKKRPPPFPPLDLARLKQLLCEQASEFPVSLIFDQLFVEKSVKIKSK